MVDANTNESLLELAKNDVIATPTTTITEDENDETVGSNKVVKMNQHSVTLAFESVRANEYEKVLDFICRAKNNDQMKVLSFLKELLDKARDRLGVPEIAGTVTAMDNNNNNVHRKDDEFSAYYGDEIDDRHVTLIILLSGQLSVIGHLIGKGGSEVSKLEQSANVSIRVENKNRMPSGSTERRICIIGSVANCTFVQQKIMQRVNEKLRDDGVNQDFLKIAIGEENVRHLIGKGGQTIQRIQDVSKTRILIEPEVAALVPWKLGREVTIHGSNYNRSLAQYMILRHMVENRSTSKAWLGGMPQPNQDQPHFRGGGGGGGGGVSGAGAHPSSSSSFDGGFMSPPISDLQSMNLKMVSNSNNDGFRRGGFAGGMDSHNNNNNNNNINHNGNKWGNDFSHNTGSFNTSHSNSAETNVFGTSSTWQNTQLPSAGLRPVSAQHGGHNHRHQQQQQQQDQSFSNGSMGDMIFDQWSSSFASQQDDRTNMGWEVDHETMRNQRQQSVGSAGTPSNRWGANNNNMAPTHLSQLINKASSANDGQYHESTFEFVCLVPDPGVAHLIGKGGVSITSIQKQSGTKISFSKTSRLVCAPGFEVIGDENADLFQKVTIVGSQRGIKMAKALMSERLADLNSSAAQ